MWEDKWVHDWPDANCKAYFLRVQGDRTIAPTAIEVIGPHPVGGWQPTLRGVHELQGDRPMKTYNTVFSVPDVEPYAKRVAAHGLGAHRITLAVNGLEAAGQAVAERGVGFALDDGQGEDAPRIRIDPASLDGLVFELVDFNAGRAGRAATRR